MSKVIVERPRLGRSRAGLKPGRTRVVVDDDGEPLRASRGGRAPKSDKLQKTKNLNENLNPLKRYLASQVGRPWRKVYSEISEQLKSSSTVQQHVRDHLDDFVATNARSVKGVLWAETRWGKPMPLSDTGHLFYVNPRTGLLLKNEARVSWKQAERNFRKMEEAERAKRMRVIDATTQVHLLKDAWWEVKLAKVKQYQKRDPHGGGYYTAQDRYTDVVHSAKLSGLPAEKLYGRHGVYACEKRQLSKAEIKRLKLR
ncbi:MAG TPA: hypothetical protein VFO00_04545 [Vitreimonas sp.]|nr:hypothetical protein [Vitreimonas sp.]